MISRALFPIFLVAALGVAAPLAAQAETARDTAWGRRHEELGETLRAAARAVGVAEPSGIVLVFADSLGDSLRVRTIETNVPDSVIAQTVARAHDQAAGLVRWRHPASFRLDPVRLRPDGSGAHTEQQPELANLSAVLVQMRRFEERFPDLVVSSVPVVIALVTRDGKVAWADVSQSSGNSLADVGAVQIVQLMRFRPASVDHVPVDVWVTMPVQTARLPTP